MTMTELTELCAGPYLPSLVNSYVTLYRCRELDRNNDPYVNLAQYYNHRRLLSQQFEGWIFDQIHPPKTGMGFGEA